MKTIRKTAQGHLENARLVGKEMPLGAGEYYNQKSEYRMCIINSNTDVQ